MIFSDMGDSRKQRSCHPQDESLFAIEQVPQLQQAVQDLSWLRERGYAENSATKLVGDRYSLTQRQRIAVGRCACSDRSLKLRSSNQRAATDFENAVIWIDGFNLLTTLEAALGNGILLLGRDGALRDMTSMHGNYRLLEDTRKAVTMTISHLSSLSIHEVVWFLDQPVSNSGRLRSAIEDIAGEEATTNHEVQVVADPDPLLKQAGNEEIVVSADSAILDSGVLWWNLAAEIVAAELPERRVLNLGGETIER